MDKGMEESILQKIIYILNTSYPQGQQHPKLTSKNSPYYNNKESSSNAPLFSHDSYIYMKIFITSVGPKDRVEIDPLDLCLKKSAPKLTKAQSPTPFALEWAKPQPIL